MAILSIQPGQVGVSNNTPSWVYIETNNTIAQVTASGFLSGAAREYVNTFKPNMMALVSTKTSPSIGVSPVLYLLQLQNVAGVWSLVAPAVDVPVPFIVLGDIQAGQSGTAGKFISFPATASKGSLVFKAVANTGDTVTTVSNAAMGQASVISIPDPGAATANFLLNTGANAMAAGSSITFAKVNGTEAANAVTASGVAGLITTSALTTAGGSTYAITWTNTKITATSVIGLTIQGGTNTTQNITFSCVPGSGTATLTIFNNTAATALNGTIFIGYSVL
jgi:hypothetical protein